jgi:NTE family protein
MIFTIGGQKQPSRVNGRPSSDMALEVLVRPSRTAFVLPGGGSRGAVQVGMLRALTARGVRPDFLVGSSVGAVNAAYFAGDASSEGVRRLEGIWLRLRRADVFPATWARALPRLFGGRDRMIDSTPLRRLLERHIQFRRLEEAPIPCHVIATDAVDGSAVPLSAGPVIDAVLASAAIPGVFPPVAVGDRLLVDGDATRCSPVATAVALGATRVIVLPTGHAWALAAGAATEIAVVPPVCPSNIPPHDFSYTAELIERAADSTERWLASGAVAEGATAEPRFARGDAVWSAARRGSTTRRARAA